MSFSNRTFDETVAMLLSYFAAQGTDVSDLLEGSVATVMLESVAIVSQQIEEDLVSRLDADIATSAYRSFDFSLLPEQAATGSIEIFPTDATHGAITIPVGTAFVVPGTSLRFLSQFETVLDVNAPAATIYVVAETPGTISNVPAGTVTRLDSSIAGIAATTNPYPFVNGRDAETEAERRVRFQRHIAKMHYGTADAIEAGLADTTTVNAFGIPTERVGRVKINEKGASLRIYITNSDILTANSPNYPFAASTQLIAAAQQAVDGKIENNIRTPGFKAAGVRTIVSGARIKPVAVNIFLRPITGYSMTLLVPAIEGAIQTLFNRLDIGENLTLQSIRRTIITTRGVEDFVLSLPSLNISAETDEVLSLIPFENVTNNPPLSNDITRSWIQRL